MVFILAPISGALVLVMRGMKSRPVGTLGTHIQPQPAGDPPTFSEQNVRDIAREAAQSAVNATSTNHGNVGGTTKMEFTRLCK